MIGTMMGKVRLLPCATMSKTLAARPKGAESKARFTLSDLYVFLARQIGIYHHTKHSSLERSPRAAWEECARRRDGWVMPQVPADREDFLIRFLPSALRTITREGVQLFALQYQSHEIEGLIAQGRPRFIRYDPRDMSRIYVEQDNGTHLRVPLADRRWPKLSLWEWNEIKRLSSGTETPADAEWVARALRANQALIDDRASAGRLKDRRRKARAKAWSEKRIPMLHPDRELTVSATLSDTPLPCEVLE